MLCLLLCTARKTEERPHAPRGSERVRLHQVIYLVFGGERHFADASRSAQSVKQHDPDARTLAYTQAGATGDLQGFDEVRAVSFTPNSGLRIDFALKLHAIADALSADSLVLDNDTYVCAPIGDVWSLLSRFDVLACHAPWRRRLRYENYESPDFVSEVPEPFCELNTGVLFFANNARTRALVEEWRRLLTAFPGSGDQYLFMDAIYRSECRLYVLPPEFNYRYFIPQFAGVGVRILHGRDLAIAKRAEAINASPIPRTTRWTAGALEVELTTTKPPRPRAMDAPPELSVPAADLRGKR